MKTTLRLPLFLFFALHISLSSAQYGLGVRAAWHNAHLCFDQTNSGRQWLEGFDGGLFYRAPIGRSLMIQPEVHYTQKGGYVRDNRELRMNYYGLHLTIHYDILAQDPTIAISPYVGGFWSKLYNIELEDIEVDVHPYAPMDYGAICGIQIIFRSRLFLDARYQLGLHELAPSLYSMTSKGYSLGAGFLF